MKRKAEGEDILNPEDLIREGERKGKLEAIIALMETTNWDVEKVMEMLKIEHEDIPTYAALVKTVVNAQA